MTLVNSLGICAAYSAFIGLLHPPLGHRMYVSTYPYVGHRAPCSTQNPCCVLDMRCERISALTLVKGNLRRRKQRKNSPGRVGCLVFGMTLVNSLGICAAYSAFIGLLHPPLGHCICLSTDLCVGHRAPCSTRREGSLSQQKSHLWRGKKRKSAPGRCGRVVFGMTLVNSLGICAAYSAFIGLLQPLPSAIVSIYLHIYMWAIVLPVPRRILAAFWVCVVNENRH